MYIKPKKRLGQNFLVDKNVQKNIIDKCQFSNRDIVLEVGAGRGELTMSIAERVKSIHALEIDNSLCKILKDNLKDYSNAQIINQDILKFDFEKYFGKFRKRIKVVGNIPYYISSPIIDYLFRCRKGIEAIFITVQKEFAKRVVAAPGSKDYGSLSCFVQYYSEPKIILRIKKTCFFPVPKVDSCLLRIDLRRKTKLKKYHEKILFRIIRAAFNKRRKTLRNSLSGIIPAKKLEYFFTKYGIDYNTRPEMLSLENFINLTKL